MGKGIVGKILDVNLSTKEIKKTRLDEETVRKYIGGLGLGVKIIYDVVGPEVDPMSDNNVVVIAPGPLNGTAAPTNGRTHVVTKSPLTGILGMGNFGGFWGPRLRKAGFEGVVVRGKSDKPVSLWINDGDVSIIEADNLWGKDTYETTDLVRENFGNDVSVLAIGQAGENLVKFACPVGDYYHAAGRCNAGCVMGNKKLKAIIVRGTKDVELADRVRFHEAVLEATDRIVQYPDRGDRRKTGSHSSRLKMNSRRGLIRTGQYATGELPKDHDFFNLPNSLEDNID
jgi:aldehyde:ferredoxin oxidoreductase